MLDLSSQALLLLRSSLGSQQCVTCMKKGSHKMRLESLTELSKNLIIKGFLLEKNESNFCFELFITSCTSCSQFFQRTLLIFYFSCILK